MNVLKQSITSLIFFYVTLHLGFSALADTGGSMDSAYATAGLGAAASLEERLTPLARGFDPDSLIYVTMSQVTTKSSAKATGNEESDTPFSLGQAPRATTIEIANVTIYVRRFELRNKIKSLVEKILKEKNIRYEILISKLPNSFTLKKEENKTPENDDKKRTAEPPTPVQKERDLSEFFPKQATEFFELGAFFFKSELPKSEKSALEFVFWLKNYVYLGSIAFATFVFLLIAFNVLFWIQGKKELRNHVAALVQALHETERGEGSRTGITRQQGRVETQRSLPEGSASTALNAMGQLGRDFPLSNQALPLEILDDSGLAALLNDCYWCREDGYAVFLWRRLTGERRSRLIRGNFLLKEYLASCREIKANNLDFEDDPYYLEPLPMDHLSLDALCELVRADPSLYGALSRMRQRALPLSFSERFHFSQSAVAVVRKSAEQLCRSQPNSPRRVMLTHFDVQIKSERDELEILPLMADLPIPFVLSSPSLIWIRRVDKQIIAKLLTRFSARELASAWSAPEEILKEMSELLPVEKQELLTEHQKRIPADRQGETYRSLCDEILAMIDKPVEVIVSGAGTTSSDGANSAA